MAKKVRPEDLSENELRRLLINKKRRARSKRLDAYRRTGRLVNLSPIPDTKNSSILSDLDLAGLVEPTEIDKKKERRKKVMDRALLFVELLAIIGLVFILFNGVNILSRLNEEVGAALTQPTPSPTPLISEVVLPSGHTPPNVEGGARFNEAEIPEHLRSVYQSYSSIAIPTPAPEHARREEGALPQGGQLIGRWQHTIKQQQGRFFKRTLCRELLNRVTTIEKDALFTVDI